LLRATRQPSDRREALTANVIKDHQQICDSGGVSDLTLAFLSLRQEGGSECQITPLEVWF
jgi:hypothetical protein